MMAVGLELSGSACVACVSKRTDGLVRMLQCVLKYDVVSCWTDLVCVC
jgi:hypothetical protein